MTLTEQDKKELLEKLKSVYWSTSKDEDLLIEKEIFKRYRHPNRQEGGGGSREYYQSYRI